MEEKKKNNKIILAVIGIIMILGIIGGVTYAYFSAQASTETQTITTAKLDIGFTNGDIIRAIDIEPIDDVDIKTKATELPFTITNNGNKDMKADIKLTNIEIDEELKNINFRWGLYNADTNKGVAFGIFKDVGKELNLIPDAVIDAKETKNYILRVWIHNNGLLQNEMQEKVFSAKVDVTAQILEYTDESCFRFDSGTGTISAYDFNVEHNEECTSDVVVPKTIDGVTVESISSLNGPGYVPIKSLILPDTITSVGSLITNTSIKNLTIPEGVKTIYDLSASNVIIPEGVTNITSLISADNYLVIPNTVSSIGMGGGSDGARSSNIILMDGLKTINTLAFSGSFTTIEIPSSVTTINQYAFSSATNLNEIIVRGISSEEELPEGFHEYWNIISVGGTSGRYNVIYAP